MTDGIDEGGIRLRSRVSPAAILLILTTACAGDSGRPPAIGETTTDGTTAASEDSSDGEGSDEQPDETGLIVRALDESGVPISGATVDLGEVSLVTDAQGEVPLPNPSEVQVLVIHGDGLLAEPTLIGPSDADDVVEVRVLSDLGGKRWVMHAGGDFMLGRRYEAPDTGEPLLPANDIAGGSRFVVEPLVPAFAAADLHMVNLETVLTTQPDSESYPKKSVVIASNPATVAALQALGVDAVMLGNNHTRDWMDDGVTETMAALDAAGIHHVGGSDDDQPADVPLILERSGVRIGVLSWATMSGSAINDRYAEDGDPVSSNPDRQWEYEARVWGFSGETWNVPMEARRIGTAWNMFEAAEPNMSEAEAAAAWASLYSVYPELQDTAAQRGHGGAAHWVASEAVEDIAALAAEVDVVVVQVHTGVEYEDAPSERAADVAHAAIDAGADIVITHHPHVIEGAEWYQGKLIVHSLGNLVFDQDRHITFPSLFLRTIWEADRLIEARFVPLMLDGYRPKLVAEDMLVQHARVMWERSQLGALIDEDAGGKDHAYLGLRHPDARDAHLRLRERVVHVEQALPATQTLEIEVPAGGTVALDYAGLIHAQAGGAPVLMGRDLLGWGSFEEALADREPSGAAFWRLEGADVGVVPGEGWLRLRLSAEAMGAVAAHPVARIPIPEHRLHHDEGGKAVPAEGKASYALRLRARLQGECNPRIRLDFYASDGTDDAPASEHFMPFDIAADGEWRALELPVATSALMVGEERMRAVLPHVILDPPSAGACELGIDDVHLIEWRPAVDMPDVFGAYDFVRNSGVSGLALELSAMPLHDD